MNWSFWIELIVRSAALLLAGELLLRLSKARRAAFRHSLLLWVFALLALLPVLSILLPELAIPIYRSRHTQTAMVTVQEVSSRLVQTSGRHSVNWPLVVWLAGVVIASAPLIVGVMTARRLASRAKPFKSQAVSLFSGVPLRLSPELQIPITCGFFRPCIVLPAAAEHWSSSRLNAVMLHELAHVHRRDVAVQVFTHLIAALWWFQPFVWMLSRSLRTESELACDAEVLSAGVRPSEYASELLAVAKAMESGWKLASPGIGMVRPCDLEERVRAVLTPPNVLLRSPKTALLAIALGTVSIAASAVTLHINEQGGSTMKHTLISALLTSAGLSAATVSGTIHDPNGAAVTDAKLLIYNPDTSTKQETMTDADGKFTFSGNGAGQYILHIEKAGFASILREFDLRAESKMDREFTMTTEGATPVADQVINTGDEQEKRVRVGGKVAQTNLLIKVQPSYPVPAKVARTQGAVELETTISKDGVPIELRVIASPSDDLSRSALEAVRQWRYRPTLLNGSPVEILTDVVVNYTLMP